MRPGSLSSIRSSHLRAAALTSTRAHFGLGHQRLGRKIPLAEFALQQRSELITALVVAGCTNGIDRPPAGMSVGTGLLLAVLI
jgi:hypothetical protein